MSDSGIIQTTERFLAQLDRRVENLERRARSLTTPEPSFGCCTLYCCNDNPGGTITTGNVSNDCETDIEDIGGVGLRLDVSGFYVIQSLGNGATDNLVGATVDGTVYMEQGRFARTVATNDIWTLPIEQVIDVNTASPLVAAFYWNIGTVSTTLVAVTLKVRVYPREGSQACGEVAGS